MRNLTSCWDALPPDERVGLLPSTEGHAWERSRDTTRLIVPFPDSKSDIAGVCATSTQEIEVTAAPPVKGAKAIRIRIKFCLGPLAFEVWVLADLMSRRGRLHSQESTVRLHHRINTGTSDIDRIVM